MNKFKHDIKNEVDLNRINENKEFRQQTDGNDCKVKQSKWAKYLSDDEDN
jgi:hypothetical protein